MQLFRLTGKRKEGLLTVCLVFFFLMGIGQGTDQSLYRFKKNTDVMSFMSNKNFSKDQSPSPDFTFGNSASVMQVGGKGVSYKLDQITIISDAIAFMDYYEYDPRLSISLEVNCRDSTIDVRYNRYVPWGKYEMLLNRMPSTPNNTQDPGWVKYGITKIEMGNPRTNGYDEVILYNGPHYVELKNNTLIRFTDPDVLTLVMGRDKIGLYNVGEFFNGVEKQVEAAQTKLYLGKFKVENNLKTNYEENDAGLFFYFNAGKLGAVELRNKICMCYCRIYITEYKEGLNFLR